MTEKKLITVTATATLKQPPSFVLLSGLLGANAPTLNLAIDQLGAKCEATRGWLQRLDATEICFYEPRFPEQVEPSPLHMVRRRQGAAGPKKGGQRTVQKRFTALWSVEGKTADEMLIFADRLLFEATEEDDAPPEVVADPSEVDWESPEAMGRYMSEMTDHMQTQLEPKEADMNLMFLARLSTEQQQALLREAGDIARKDAVEIAAATGNVLGELHSIDRYDHHRIARKNIENWAQSLSFVNEIPYGDSDFEILSFGPRRVSFDVKLTTSFEFAPQS